MLASAIMDPAVQVAFNQAKGAIPARTDIDLSAMDACAQATSASLAANDAGGTAVPTFAGTHAANAAVVGAATDAITAFFNSARPPKRPQPPLPTPSRRPGKATGPIPYSPG